VYFFYVATMLVTLALGYFIIKGLSAFRKPQGVTTLPDIPAGEY